MHVAEPSRKIEATKRGTKPGLWIFKMLLRLFGLRGAYGLLYFVGLHYALFDRTAVPAALAYVARRFPGCSRLKRRFLVYRLFVSQGKQLIDRHAIISGSYKFDIELKGYEQFMAMVRDKSKGFIMLTAHVGNWQIAMEALKGIERTVHLVMRPEDNPAVKESFRIDEDRGFLRIISPEQFLGGVVEVMGVLEKGEIVSIMGDRSYGFKALDVSFLGDKAWLPYGAFAIAAAAECPVVVLLSAKESAGRYVVDASHVLYPRYEGRRNKTQQLKKWVQEFAAVLEAYVEQYPYQCFLFHDVWTDESREKV